MFGFPFSPNVYVPREHLVPRRTPARSAWDEDDDEYGYNPYEELRSSKPAPLRGYPHSFPFGQMDDDEEEDERYQQHIRKNQLAREHERQHSKQQPQPQVRQPHHQQSHQPHQKPVHANRNHSSKKGSFQVPITQGSRQQPVKKVVDYEASAKKIQKLWRGWNVRHQLLIEKLRLLKKIEQEVDRIQQVNADLLKGIIPADSQYVGDVPRPILAFEHELTFKLLDLDAISVHGPSDIIRLARKALVNKIEGILSRTDEVKRNIKQERLSNAMKAMQEGGGEESQTQQDAEHPEVPLASEPNSIQDENEEDQTTCSQDQRCPEIHEEEMISLLDAANLEERGQNDSPTEQLMDIDIPAEQEMNIDMPTEQEMSIETIQDDTNIKDMQHEDGKKEETLPRQIPSLKRMCYNVCDQVIRQALSQNA